MGLIFCLLALAGGSGCVGLAPGDSRYEYFTQPAPEDQWSPKISGWQRRERAQERAAVVAPAAVSEAAPTEAASAPAPGIEIERPVEEAAGGDLRAKYDAFRAEQKRATARSVAAWTQSQALAHYVEDGPIDHWATLEETLRNNGDDCDGLELLTFNALRDLGFEMTEVFRAIVYRASDGQHHMVTLWFENLQDPWVIDPTGAMTLGMPRMSELPGWVPIKLFSDTAEYTVSRGAPGATPATELAENG
ncbi:MAG TPA: hypothetical protein EYQ54_03555 [Myxococcales bacterium]|nr:hypothetical protein [Myxococcales bacterium]HIL01130.1 hypothetical protein [Myxococcales bacterium]